MRELLRPAVLIPESKKLNVLLREFRQSRNHMAIVIDEYGGVAGLVTIEDVLEQIVGDIDDEHDDGEEPELQGDLVRADRGRGEPRGHRGRRQEARLERHPADQQVAAERQLLRDGSGAGPQRHPFGDQRAGEKQPAQGLRRGVRHGGADQPEAGREDEQRAERGGEQVRAEDEEQRAPGVLHPAQPPVAGRGQQQAGGAQGRDPQPLPGGAGHVGAAAGEGTRQRAGAELHPDRDQQPDREGEPGGLYPLGHRRRPGHRRRTGGRLGR